MPGAGVVVFGPGAIGLYVAQIAKLAGAKAIIVGTEGDEKRLFLAQSLGIYTVNNSVQDLDEVIQFLFPKEKPMSFLTQRA
jgi:threonine dehydrogenase-like Zn-dependent dehydrogenase